MQSIENKLKFAYIGGPTALLEIDGFRCGAAIIVYIVGSLAGIRLLREKSWRRILPWLALAISLAAIPFVGLLAVPAVVVSAIGFLYGSKLNRHRALTGQEELLK